MRYILVAVAGLLAGLLIMTVVMRFLVGKKCRGAAAKASEFTQFMILSDNAILWYICVAYTALAAYSIYTNFSGSLPWLTGGLGLAFAAWATIQSFLIKKSERQNTAGGITYDTAMANVKKEAVEKQTTETFTEGEVRDC